MINRNAIKFPALAIVFIALMVFAGTYTYSNKSQPPAGRTNAPNESSCTGCHSGTLNSGSGSLSFSFGSGQNSYTPGNTYSITVGVTDATKSVFGFEMTALDNNNTTSVGTFAVVNSGNTSLSTSSISGSSRQYIGHKSGNSNSSWTFNWTAPSQGTGKVTFYLVGNATNNSGNTLGDLVYADTFQIAEGVAPPTAAFSGSPTTVCKGSSISFTDNSTGGVTSWNWSFPGGTPSSSTSQNPSITYDSTGMHNVQLIVSGAGGSDTILQTNYVTVNDNPAIALASLTDNACNGGSTGAINVNISGGTPNYSFSWSNSSTTQNIGSLVAGSYTLTVTDGNSCTASSSFTVNEPTAISTAMSATPDSTSSSVGTATVNASGGTPPYSYSWNTNPAQTTATATGLPVGTYTVVVTDSNGCTSTDSVEVSLMVSNARGLVLSNIHAYPNPVVDQLEIRHDYGDALSVQLFDLKGTKVELEVNQSNGEMKLDMSELNSGHYILYFRVPGGMATKKILKSNF